MKKLRDIHQIAADNLGIAQERNAKYYNKSHRDVQYEIGNRVWKRNRVLSTAANFINAKLVPKFSGPYTTASKLGTCVYELQDDAGLPAGKIHVKDLKPAYEDGPTPTTSDEESGEEEATVNKPQEDQHQGRNKPQDRHLTGEFEPGQRKQDKKAPSSRKARKRGRPCKTTLAANANNLETSPVKQREVESCEPGDSEIETRAQTRSSATHTRNR